MYCIHVADGSILTVYCGGGRCFAARTYQALSSRDSFCDALIACMKILSLLGQLEIVCLSPFFKEGNESFFCVAMSSNMWRLFPGHPSWVWVFVREQVVC